MRADNIGGRILPFEPGTSQYETDEFRGQRRRPWMAFRVGAMIQEITKEHFMNFIEKVRLTIIDKGLLLDSHLDCLKVVFAETNYKKFYDELEEGLARVKEKYEKGPLSRPIVLLFYDNCEDDHEDIDSILHHYRENMYFFTVESHELISMLQTSEYDYLQETCEEFFNFVYGCEDLRESRAIRMPIEKKQKIFGAGFNGEQFMDLTISSSSPQRKHYPSPMYRNNRRENYSNAPPGLDLVPPGLQKHSNAYSNIVSPPPGLSHPSSSRAHENFILDTNKTPHGIRTPPGLNGPAQPQRSTIYNGYDNYDSDSSPENYETEVKGPHILAFSDVQAARRQMEDDDYSERGVPIRKNESHMAKYINGSKLYARFDQPFVSITCNLDLLFVINYAVSSRNKEIRPASKAILSGAFDRGYPVKLKNKFLNRSFKNGRWSYNEVELFFEIIQLYFYTARFKGGFMLSIDSFRPAWTDFHEAFVRTSKDGLRDAKVNAKELGNAERLMNHVNKWLQQAEDESGSIARPIRSSRDFSPRRVTSSRLSEESRYYVDDHRNRRMANRDDYTSNSTASYHDGGTEYDRQDRRYEYDDIGRDEVDDVARYRSIESNYGAGTSKTDRMVNLTLENTIREQDIEVESSIGEIPNDSSVVNTDERPKQEYKYTEANYEPPWVKSEITEPPEDFKTLTSVPVLADYVNPTEPYLRRIQEDGIYKSAAHYLDVQFRLHREDLVSPLRDGIDLYRKNGTCRGRRIEGAPCSDILIFDVDRVDGKQVSEREGLEMRVVWPAKHEISKLLLNDKEMKELGLLMLSDDGFVNDFHLTFVKSSYLLSRECLHLAILGETAPFKPNKSYQAAEGNSYLPSCKHVLENMKRINPFKPIPFERYLVHGQVEIFRPLFHRHEKSETQVAEEKRLEKHYGEVRSIAAANRYLKGKPVPKGADDEDDGDDLYYKVRSSTAVDKDLEYEQLSEPIFREMLGVNSGGSDQLMIGKKWYRISRLLDDFHPDNFDESQRIAFCQTFRHELSLIQGPPGTGKTHIGVQIVKTMLQNRSHWRMTEPILIVSYTNRGLDNLLERIWHMIDEDEELSRDNGKPRMIRYGRNCDSELLKKRCVTKFDVDAQYKSSVADKIQQNLRTAFRNKTVKRNELAISSNTLLYSKKDLLSFNILSRVMDPNHQMEISQFASQHVDTKKRLLCPDEAFACWLLDQDFGKSIGTKTKNEKMSTFKKLPSNSDDETTPNAPSIDEEDDSDLDDEQFLDNLFKKMNLGCSKETGVDASLADDASEYYSRGKWEIAYDQNSDLLVLLGRNEKNGGLVDRHIASLVQEVKEIILSTPPLLSGELEDIKFIFSLARPKRWALYNTWCYKLRNLIAENLPRQIKNYEKACEEVQKASDRLDAEIMKMPMIIGATTSGCSRLRPILEMVKPRILIVEEAAEVFEAHIISAMISSIEHAVMIGDHKQIRPKPAVHELGTEYGLEISMFERLVERGLPFSQLREQHRMNSTIAELIVRPALYDNVHDSKSVLEYPDVEGMASNLFFWCHAEKEETPDGVSWMNRYEANMTAELVKYFLKQSYTADDIVVLATYSAQRAYFYQTHSSVFGTQDSPIVPVETVDSYQGREKKIVIVSLVRSHRGVKENTGIGFLAVSNRICVALTRAQHGMYIIGNGAYLMNNSVLWKKIANSLDKHQLISYDIPLKCTAHANITMINSPDQFKTKSPEGGCSEICNLQKGCGHKCLRSCHPNVEYEHGLSCEYKCSRTCSNREFNHECPKRCYEDCGNCMFLVETILECGHEITTPCSRIGKAGCDRRCGKKIACGHKCVNMCGLPCTETIECQQMVEIVLECRHRKRMKCFMSTADNLNLNCVERCEKRLFLCGHQCAELCGQKCTEKCAEMVTVTLKCGHEQEVKCSTINLNESTAHIQCESLVSMKLEPCGHTGLILCGTNPSTELCKERCKKLLSECGHICGDDCGACFKNGEHICQQRCPKTFPCGHKCVSKCGEKCSPCKSFCSNTCEHQSCGIGENGFGRSCHELCVLCSKSCSNKCIHRSCSKRCFEECDVDTCAELCAEKLKCGHACLGMCGELCPKMCGTCERNKYLECVAELQNAKKIHPLIMLPKCHHVFPLESLDDHIKKQKEANEQLDCPKCGASISAVCRFAKYTKKRILKINMTKLREETNSTKYDVLMNHLKQIVGLVATALDSLRSNQSKEVANLLIVFRTNTFDVFRKFSSVSKAEKWRLEFACKIVQCFLAVSRLFYSSSLNNIYQKKNIPPIYGVMVLRVFGQPAFEKIIAELKVFNEDVLSDVETELLGVVMPKLRFKIAKLLVLNQFIMMGNSLKNSRTDVTDADVKIIVSACSKFFAGGERQQMSESIALVEQVLLKAVPNMAHMEHFLSWKDLHVPDF